MLSEVTRSVTCHLNLQGLERDCHFPGSRGFLYVSWTLQDVSQLLDKLHAGQTQ